MKKQHWRRRSLFPDSIVTQRKVTVLQRGARYESASKPTQDLNVVHVNHRQLLSEGVIIMSSYLYFNACWIEMSSIACALAS